MALTKKIKLAGGSKHKHRRRATKGRRHIKSKRRVRSKSRNNKRKRRHRGGSKRILKGGSSSLSAISGIPEGAAYPLSLNGVPSGLPQHPISTSNYFPINAHSVSTPIIPGVPQIPGVVNQSGGAPLWLTKIMPNEFVNVPRSIYTGAANIYNGWVGQSPAENPLPQYDQLVNTSDATVLSQVPNVPAITLKARQMASDI